MAGSRGRNIVLGCGLLGAVGVVALVLAMVVGVWLVVQVRNAEAPRAESGASSAVAGPFDDPYFCTSVLMGLGEPVGPDCDVAPQVRHFAIVDRAVQRYVPGEPHPPGLSVLDGPGGAPVDGIVRFETGSINRALYRIAMLDPAGDTNDPFVPSAWNGRVLFVYGGGCGVGHGQGIWVGANDEAEWIRSRALLALTRGYAVVSTTHNIGANNCNDALSADTAQQMLDLFGSRFGEPEFVVARGGSGGAMSILLTLQNYPGILDAAMVSSAFPDAFTVIGGAGADCRLLANFFASDAGASFSDEQRAAVGGHASSATCENWNNFGGVLDQALDESVCVLWVPGDITYRPNDRPDGVRCSLTESNAASLGRDPATGAARRPWDNVGVPYGLRALEDGIIDPDQFLTLNRRIGGFDADGRLSAGRSVGDRAAVEAAYSSGRVFRGVGVDTVPILVLVDDLDDNGDVHTMAWARTIRTRIEAANDGRSNVVEWTRGAEVGLPLERQGLAELETWLVALGERAPGDRDVSAAEVGELRPDSLTDLCAAGGAIIAEGSDVHGARGACTERFPAALEPRRAAGAPDTDQVLQCVTRPATEWVAERNFTDEQRREVELVFPDGVCDWEIPAPGTSAAHQPWFVYD
jgi:hypothetical protein